jgi:hypothetical protein
MSLTCLDVFKQEPPTLADLLNEEHAVENKQVKHNDSKAEEDTSTTPSEPTPSPEEEAKQETSTESKEESTE